MNNQTIAYASPVEVVHEGSQSFKAAGSRPAGDGNDMARLRQTCRQAQAQRRIAKRRQGRSQTGPQPRTAPVDEKDLMADAGRLRTVTTAEIVHELSEIHSA